MPKIYIDNIEYTVDKKKNLLEACLSLGFDLPYFCWHPAMRSVGACRQCAIKKFKDENDKEGKIVMACMEAVEDGARISVHNQDVIEFRANNIQWLMTNHPHDCPICDEGGECHLQDMTVMTGHTYRKFRFKKRTYRNQDLGPFINHEMNRCIQCYRCVRFYREYAGGRDLDVFAAHNHVYFGRHEDGVLESEFSGNLVEVCPTGVFTDKSLKEHYSRKWDLTTAPSVCHHCGLGCNIIPGERYGTLRRVRSRFNHKVNQYFICDRGRYGYGFVNGEKRVTTPLLRESSAEKPRKMEKDKFLSELKSRISGKELVGIGSPRASLEANHALRLLVGEDNFYQGISRAEHKIMSTILDILQNGPARTPSLAEIEQCDAILILGEDLTNSAPMMDLAIRQALLKTPMKKVEKLNIPEWHDAALKEAIQDDKSPLFILTPNSTKLDEHAESTARLAPSDIARMGFAIARAIDGRAPEVKDLDKDQQNLVKTIADKLSSAKKPLIICGTTLMSESIIHAAANISLALHHKNDQVQISITVPECNSMGLALMGGKSMEELLNGKDSGNEQVLFVLENNLHRHMNKEKTASLLKKYKTVISLDYLEHQTASIAHMVIPVGAFSETDGTLVNNEGRAQRYYQVYVPAGDIQESWRWIHNIMDILEKEKVHSLQNLNDFTHSVAETYPVFKKITEAAPPPGFRIAGEKIPRQPHRFSGRTAMNANINVSEPKPPVDPDSPLSFTMEGYHGQPPAPVIPFFWSPGWNSEQSINKFQIEVGGPLHGGDPGIRLIEPPDKNNHTYYKDIPARFDRSGNEWLVVPLVLIFGSEELSSLSKPITKRIPESFIVINTGDAEKHNFKKDSTVQLSIDSTQFSCRVRMSDSIPAGVAGFATGLPGQDFVELPEKGKISGGSQ